MFIPFCLLSKYYACFDASLRENYNVQRYHFFLIQKPFAEKIMKKISEVGLDTPWRAVPGRGSPAEAGAGAGEKKMNR